MASGLPWELPWKAGELLVQRNQPFVPLLQFSPGSFPFFLHFYGLVGDLKHPSAFPADGKGGAAGALWDTRGQRCPWEVAPGLLWLIQVWDWIYSSGIPSESARLGIVTAGASEGA